MNIELKLEANKNTVSPDWHFKKMKYEIKQTMIYINLTLTQYK
jgi:hypothetical protein